MEAYAVIKLLTPVAEVQDIFQGAPEAVLATMVELEEVQFILQVAPPPVAPEHQEALILDQQFQID